MSEELISRGLLLETEKIGKWDFYRIGNTNLTALKQNGIIRSVDYGDLEKKKIDGLIVQNKNVIAVVEYKISSEFNTPKKQDKAIKQEIKVAKKLGSKIIIATDTLETVWVNTLTEQRIKDENGNEIKINFNPKDEKLTDLIEKINYSISETSDSLKPRQLVNPTDLAKQIWQDIWSVSGESPANCLYSFVELFIFKYLSDLGVLGQGANFDHLMERFAYNIENPDEEALEYYATNIRTKIKTLFPKNLLDNTTIINGTVFINKDQRAVRGYSTVFKKVLTRFKNYGKLENIDYDFKSQLFESFLKEGISKKNLGQFFTPLKVVRAIVKMAESDIRVGIKICDPACGVGKFLLEPIIKKLSDFYEINSKTGITRKITIHGFDKGFDNEEQKTIILAKANMLIYFSDLIRENPGLTKEFSDLFNDSFTLKTNSILGTLSDAAENEYDLILTNPPYVTSGSSNIKEEVKKDATLKKYYKVNAMGVEGLFLEWIVRALKPNGKAYVVIPDGTLNRQNDKHLRKFLLDECLIDGLISLPLNTFFTTNKKTYILCLTKKGNKRQIQKDPVFTYFVSEIGESRDINRFDIDQDDLTEAVTLYSFFRGNKQEFTKINTDKRCKVLPFNFFETNVENNWVIDKIWTEEERINLGILEKKESVTLSEFSSIMADVAASIKEMQGEVKAIAEKKTSEITYRLTKLNELFYIQKGQSKYTKKFGDQNKGPFPVYSASNNEPLTSINTYDFEGEYLTWAANGFAGYIKPISGKFSINGDRGILKPKETGINIHYIKQALEPMLRQLAKGRKGEKGQDEFTKVYPSMIGDIEVLMPVNDAGRFDINAQNEVVKKLFLVDNIKQKADEYKKKIFQLRINSVENILFKETRIGDIFDFPETNSKITKAFCLKNTGTIPVYASAKSETSVLGFIKDGLPGIKYYSNCLSWNRNGSVGYVFIRDHIFATNEDHRAMTIKDGFRDHLNESYLKYEIELKLFENGFSFVDKCGVDKIKKVKIRIPKNDKGEFDLSRQKQIARIYKRIGEIKFTIGTELEKISDTAIALQ